MSPPDNRWCVLKAVVTAKLDEFSGWMASRTGLNKSEVKNRECIGLDHAGIVLQPVATILQPVATTLQPVATTL